MSSVLFVDRNNGTMGLIGGPVKVAWVCLGEGRYGDYDPTDPDDEELLRFDIYLQDETGEYRLVEDASYCTRFPAKASDELKLEALRLIMACVYEPLISGRSIKHTCELLSWIEPSWISDQLWNHLTQSGNVEQQIRKLCTSCDYWPDKVNRG